MDRCKCARLIFESYIANIVPDVYFDLHVIVLLEPFQAVQFGHKQLRASQFIFAQFDANSSTF